MDVSENITATLQAQDHGHHPVVCFEPGIAKREGADSRFVVDRCGTLRADMGDNQPAVCYSVNCRNLKTNMEVAYETIRPVAYAVENHPNDSRARIDPNGIVQTLSSRMGTGGNNTPMVLIPVSENRNEFRCFQNTEQGWWNESDTAATLRTPCGGDSVKANLIVETAEG